MNICAFGRGTVTSRIMAASSRETLVRANHVVPLLYHETMVDLRDELTRSGDIIRLQYIPSGYRGGSINRHNMDNLFVKRIESTTITPSTTFEGCALLEDSANCTISPREALEGFQQRVVRALKVMGVSEQIKVQIVGPLLELTHYVKRWRSTPCYIADVVFCLEVFNGSSFEIYYPQSANGDNGSDEDLWTRAEIPAKNSAVNQHIIGRLSVRILRSLASRDVTLKVLTPVVIEQAILYIKTETHSDFWAEDDIKKAVEMVLKFIATAVQNKLLKKHSSLSIGENVLPPMSGVVRDHVVASLRRMATEPDLQHVVEAL